MASVTHGPLDKISWYLQNKRHDAWDAFSTAQQAQMIEDDLAAANRVSAILVSLITAGLILSIVSLVVVLMTQ